MTKNSTAPALIVFSLLFLTGCGSGDEAGESTAPEPATQTEAPADLVPFAEATADGDRHGYRDSTGRVVIEPRFLMADPFSESGLAAVVDESGWAYIDVKGRVLVRPFIFDNGPDPFSDGLARFEREGRFGFFDEGGKIVVEPRFDFALPFSEGLAAVCTGCVRVGDGEHWSVSGGRWGYIRRNGEEAIPLAFDEAGRFEGGRARVVEAGESKWITPDGRPAP